MANTACDALIDTIRARAARSNDTVLITEDFVLAALNEAQIHIVRNMPRHIDLDKSDTTTYRIDRWATTAHVISTAVRASTGVVTITSATAHGLEVGDIATVAGTSGSDTTFNGNFEILSVADTTHVTYFSNLADESASTVGTITKLAAKPTYDISTLAPAHIGGIWILNGASTGQGGLRYRPLPEFREKYIPVSSQSESEPTEYTRQGSNIIFNCPIARAYQGLNLRIDYTAWATALTNAGSSTSELSNSDKGLIRYALAEIYDEIALAQPKFESKALKTRVLFNDWLDEYMDYNDMLLEELENYLLDLFPSSGLYFC